MNSDGDDARGPSLDVSASSTNRRRSAASSASMRSATGPNVNDAITPGDPAAGDASSVTSHAEPGCDVCPLKPSARQNGSSYTTSVFVSGPPTSLRYSASRSSGSTGSNAISSASAGGTATTACRAATTRSSASTTT